MDMHGYAWLCTDMHAYVRILMDMKICVDMYWYARLWMDVHGYAWIWLYMYGYVWMFILVTYRVTRRWFEPLWADNIERTMRTLCAHYARTMCALQGGYGTPARV